MIPEKQLILIDKNILIIAIAATVATIGIVIAGTIYLIKLNSKGGIKEGAKATALILERLNILEMTTVLIIIATLILLVLADKIKEDDGIISLLSAIVGYVLGSLNQKNKKSVTQPDSTGSDEEIRTNKTT